MTVNTQLDTARVPFPIFKNVVDISSASILTMYTTPVLIIPAQGAHKVISIHDVFFEYHFNSIQYANGSGMQLQYGNTGSGGGTEVVVSANINVNSASSNIGTVPATPYTLVGVTSDMVNQGIYATTTINNYTSGNGTIRVSIFYTVVTTTA